MVTPRIHYLDWLKVLIVYGIVVFHVSLVFSFGPWLVNNPDRSFVLSAFAGFCFPWGIPAMFLIAGADAWFGLNSHSIGHFVKARVERLLIPLVAGLIVLAPFQRYVTSHNPPPPIGQLGGFYVVFFGHFQLDVHLEWIATYWMHLWFLAYLFAISIVCAPVLAWLHQRRGCMFSAEVARIANRRGGMYLLAAPLLISQVVLRPLFPEYQGWADFATYTIVFISGAVLFSSRGFEQAIRRDIRLALITGTVAIAGIGLILFLSPGHVPPGRSAPLGLDIVYAMLWALDVWSWLLAILYLGIRWFDFSNRFLVYARESVLPVYVLHHPVVVTIASFVVTMGAGIWPKFLLLVVASFGLTLGLYDVAVRRWPVTRFLFGLKPLARHTRSTNASEGGGSASGIAVARR
jgi:glucans biosynthesis protein C